MIGSSSTANNPRHAWLDASWLDLRFALRSLLKRPGSALAGIITLASGIAASVAVVSVVNSLLLRPLSLPDADRLVVLFATSPERGIYRDTTSFPDFLDWKTRTRSFIDAAAYRTDPVNLTAAGTPERILSLRASYELFNVLGTHPAMGRSFDRQEQEGGIAVALISHGLWMRRFGGDAVVLGRSIMIDDISHSVIGVLPQGFRLPSLPDPEVIVPVPQRPSRSTGYIRSIARLRDGVTVAAAQRELNALAMQLEEAFPVSNRGRGVNVVPLREVASGGVRAPLLVLTGAALFVLLIGCANVGGLALARGIDRRQEFAVRAALGAGAGRLGRQLLIESLALASIAAVLGTVLAVWGNRILITTLSRRFPLPEVHFDWTLLALAAGAAVFAGVLCGLAPALMVWRTELAGSINPGIRNRCDGPLRQRLRSLLVVAEAALTMVLLVGAGLLLKSFVLLQQVDPGFDPRHVLTADLTLSKRYEDPERRQVFLSGLLDSIGSLPGVQHAAVLTDTLVDAGARETFVVEGRTNPDPRQGHAAGFNVVSSDVFRAAGIPLRLGRAFEQEDNWAGAAVAIVNETMARQFWPNESPIGKRIRLYYDKDPQRWLSIVGVAGDVRDRGRETEPRPLVFVPYQQSPYRSLPYAQRPFVSLVVRTAGDPAERIGDVRARIWAVDKDQPVSNLRTMAQALSNTVADRRLYLLLLGSFAATALIVATSGIYALIAYAAASRTREMGIRLSLGATAGHVRYLVLRYGMLLIASGIGIGIAGSIILTKALSPFLFGTGATDPSTFVVTTVLFGTVALVAACIPARRAARTDPAVAFRHE